MYNETGSTSVAWYPISQFGSAFLEAKVSAGSNISWIATHPSLPVVFAVQESPAGLIGAYTVDAATHRLSSLGSFHSSGGNYPVHACSHAPGRFLFVANYGGSVAVLPLQLDGSLSPPSQIPNTGSFAHCVVLAPLSHDHVFVVSLANDAVNQYVFDQRSGAILHLPPGTAPSHLLFHPLHPMAFLSDEGNGTTAALISVCAHDVTRGTLSFLGSWSAIPEGASAKGLLPSELVLSKDSRFLYVSILDSAGKHDSIAVFRVQAATSDVRRIANVPVCSGPRSITLAERGTDELLVVGCEQDRSIQIFSIDRETGFLKWAGADTMTTNPVALVGQLRAQQAEPHQLKNGA